MNDPHRIDYENGIIAGAPADRDLVSFLSAELPMLWFRAYKAATPHPVNVQRLNGADDNEYLFDIVDELVQMGELAAADAAPSRLVAVHGRSRPVTVPRDSSRMKSTPLGTVAVEEARDVSEYDRGHMIAHGSGGGVDINLVPQLRSLNQGRSAEGKRYRAMERYCAKNPGTYCFSRLIYTTLTDHPRWIEFGIVEEGQHLRVERFSNVGSEAEMAEIERVFRARGREMDNLPPES